MRCAIHGIEMEIGTVGCVPCEGTGRGDPRSNTGICVACGGKGELNFHTCEHCINDEEEERTRAVCEHTN